MRLAAILIFVTTMFAAPLAYATDGTFRQIKGQELLDTFKEVMVIGEYHQDTGGIEHYKFTEYHNADGTSDYIELGADPLVGHWQIVGEDKVCYRYEDSETFNQTYCFFIYKSGTCYYNFSLGAMTVNGPRNYDWWVSRFVRKGDGGTCAEPVS